MECPSFVRFIVAPRAGDEAPRGAGAVQDKHARRPRLPDNEGVIVGGGRYQNTVRIIFDGFKSPMLLDRDYIELVARGAGTKPE